MINSRHLPARRHVNCPGKYDMRKLRQLLFHSLPGDFFHSSLAAFSFPHGKYFIPPWLVFHSTLADFSFLPRKYFIPPWLVFHSPLADFSFLPGKYFTSPWQIFHFS